MIGSSIEKTALQGSCMKQTQYMDAVVMDKDDTVQTPPI